VPAESPYVIELSGEDRSYLERLARRASAPHRVVMRAKIVLALADGASNAAAARHLGVGVDTVRRWRRRFSEQGPAGLVDRKRPGRPKIYGPAEQLAIVATATQQTPEADSHWSHRLLAATLKQRIGISAAQIGRVLKALSIKVHRVRGWLNRPADPDFAAKATAVCDLYLNPPPNTVLLSLDEKTSIQAKSRKHPTRPAAPGQAEQREFEYIRHGTASLMAALDVRNGEVLGRIIGRNNSATFIGFLHELDQMIHPGLDIHLILDNGSSHTSKATKTWLAAHPRFTVTYTPKHASWLNQIELFFSILTRRLLRRGEFSSRQDLADKIENFIEVYDRTAKPFRWTYDGTPLKAA
jgi:transposase